MTSGIQDGYKKLKIFSNAPRSILQPKYGSGMRIAYAFSLQSLLRKYSNMCWMLDVGVRFDGLRFWV